MSYPYLIQGKNIIITINMVPHTITTSHIAYDKVKEAIIAKDWAVLPELVQPKTVVLNYGMGNVSIQGEKFFWKGREMHNALSSKMIDMLKEGFPIEPLVNFMGKLLQNPSKRAVEELYLFLEKGQLPITPDGNFLAYKKVRNDYLDVHSHSVLNKPADLLTRQDYETIAGTQGKKGEVTVAIVGGVTTVSMPRNEVNDDRDNTCSEGLHFCSLDYLGNFGGDRIVVLSIDPADVVSIPSDYNNTKGRTARYQVVGELTVDAKKAFTSSVQTTAHTDTKSGAWAPAAKPVVKAAAPAGPKLGNTAFYDGYTLGFKHPGSEIGCNYNDHSAVDAFWDGVEKGSDDARDFKRARYQFNGYYSKGEVLSALVPVAKPVVKQEYDANGNALSMTKDAIRKRKARALKKATPATAPKAHAAVWPFPIR